MDNPFNPDPPIKAPHVKTKGKTKTNHTMIAALIARGFSVKYVAKKVKMSESRIYHLLCDKDSLVNAEIKRILTELFASADRHLINLYDKTLQKLDTMLSSSDEEKQYRAIDRIIKMFFARIPKNTIIQQYFGDQVQPQREFTMDDYILFSNKLEKMILQKRKDRGLPWPPDNYIQNAISEVRKARGLPELSDHDIQDIISKVLNKQGLPELPDHKASSHSTPKPSTHSSPENLTPHDSPQDASSQGTPSQDAPSPDVPTPVSPSPNVPPANAPSPSHSSEKSIDEFVESTGLNESTT